LVVELGVELYGYSFCFCFVLFGVFDEIFFHVLRGGKYSGFIKMFVLI
jgi:hypothetical protein